MTNENKFFTRIRAADTEPPATAYATEIPSNQHVVGNLNSQYKYTQTKDEDNGRGTMEKTANKYLEKIAMSLNTVKSWPSRLVKNIKDAEPLTQVGIGGGTLIGAGKLKSWNDDRQSKKHHATLEERSLKTLQSINRNLAKANGS